MKPTYLNFSPVAHKLSAVQPSKVAKFTEGSYMIISFPSHGYPLICGNNERHWQSPFCYLVLELQLAMITKLLRLFRNKRWPGWPKPQIISNIWIALMCCCCMNQLESSHHHTSPKMCLYDVRVRRRVTTTPKKHASMWTRIREGDRGRNLQWVGDYRFICTDSLQALRLSNCPAAWPWPCHPFQSVTIFIFIIIFNLTGIN